MNSSRLINSLQDLLYIWISKFDKRSLVVIKSKCDFLNESHKLGLSNPIWALFWPLVFNGLIDHIGNGYYAVTKPLIIDYSEHYVYVNLIPNSKSKRLDIGISMSKRLDNPRNYDVIRVNTLSILKKFPAINTIVDSFPKSLQDERKLVYYQNARKGIAKLEEDGLTRYFSIPEKLYMRELPDRTINPEAFAIAYSYSRVINEENNGTYNREDNSLSIPTYACPLLLYRALLLHSLSFSQMPDKTERFYTFRNVPEVIVKQLNRILCNSISYE